MHVLAGIVSGFMLAALGWVCLILGQLGSPTPNTQWVREAYEFKDARAARIEAPKIAIIAGSTGLFGIASDALSRHYRRPVINQSVNAGLELPYILSRGRQILDPGDIAILPLEYPLFNYDRTTNEFMIDYYLSEPGLFGSQDLALQIELAADVSLKRIAQGYRGLPEGFEVTGQLGVHNLSAAGDQLHSSVTERRPDQLESLLAQGARTYGRDFSERNESWRILADMQRWADDREVCLIYVPPPFLFRASYRTDPLEARFYSGLPGRVRAVGSTYVGDPYEFMYEPEQFFDTPYHLVAEAREIHTDELIRVLGDDLEAHCGGARSAERSSPSPRRD